VDEKLHVAVWLFQAWTLLQQRGCTKSIPDHPMELLTGYYERIAAQDPARRRPFRIQQHITRELMTNVGETLRTRLDSIPAQQF
jgi:hypothetical protein